MYADDRMNSITRRVVLPLKPPHTGDIDSYQFFFVAKGLIPEISKAFESHQTPMNAR